ncbi:MAG: MotA/TolQ/ExbB proton channel family protein [Desulfobulbaceae bacterium]|nr:MotA/TolQ/ExbB proton channel family protein [Desulfobulbaceae bacterium]
MLLKIIMLAGVMLFFFLADFLFGSTNLSANCKSVVLVVAGPFLGIALAYQLPLIKSLYHRIVKMFKQEGEAKEFILINEIEELADAWHSGGNRLLEKVVPKSTNSLLRSGAGMIADGYKVEEIRKVLARQCRIYFADRATEGEILLALGRLTQTFGFIGTIVGMIRVFGAIGDPAAMGNGMAIALISSLHGLMLANFVYVPLYKKFEAHLNDEHKNYTLIMEGVNCLALGKSTRAISYRLNSFLGREHKMVPGEIQVIPHVHHHMSGNGMLSRAA